MTSNKLKFFQDVKQGEDSPEIEDLYQLCDEADKNLHSLAKALPGLVKLVTSQESKIDSPKPNLAQIYKQKEADVNNTIQELQTLKNSLVAAHEESTYRNR